MYIFLLASFPHYGSSNPCSMTKVFVSCIRDGIYPFISYVTLRYLNSEPAINKHRVFGVLLNFKLNVSILNFLRLARSLMTFFTFLISISRPLYNLVKISSLLPSFPPPLPFLNLQWPLILWLSLLAYHLPRCYCLCFLPRQLPSLHSWL